MVAKSHDEIADDFFRKAVDELDYANTPDVASQRRERALANAGAYAQLAFVCAVRHQCRVLEAMIRKLSEIVGGEELEEVE